MIEEREKEARTVKTAYDLATLIRVLPWLFISGDRRGPQVLAAAAFEDAKGFIESHVADQSRDRRALMRGLTINWIQAMGGQVDPETIEFVVNAIAQTVDEKLSSEEDVIKGQLA